MRRKPDHIIQAGSQIPTLSFSRPDDQKLLFEIIDLSDLNRDIPTASHRHNFYELLIITKGKTKDWVDFKEYAVCENEILSIPKGCVHQNMTRKGIGGFILLFTPDFFSREQHQSVEQLEVFNNMLPSHLISFHGYEIEWTDLAALFGSLHNEYLRHSQLENNSLLRYLLLAFCFKINEVFKIVYPGTFVAARAAKPFLDLLEKHFREQHAVSFYCSKLNCTAKALSLLLQKAVGKSTQELIAERIFLEAKRELIFSRKSIKETAAYLGFDDPLYFSKYFKKHTGYSPKDFKEQFSGKSI